MANCSSLGAFDTWVSTSAVREVELMQSLYCTMALTGPNLFYSSCITYPLVIASVFSSDTSDEGFSRILAHSATGLLITAILFFSSMSFQRTCVS